MENSLKFIKLVISVSQLKNNNFKLQWALSHIWLLKCLENKNIQIKSMFGQSALLHTKFYLVDYISSEKINGKYKKISNRKRSF
jgi:hypothetical protein